MALEIFNCEFLRNLNTHCIFHRGEESCSGIQQFAEKLLQSRSSGVQQGSIVEKGRFSNIGGLD
jgi:hypothetical protein